MQLINQEVVVKKRSSRLMKNTIMKGVFFSATIFCLLVLGILLYRILSQGIPYLDGDFFQNFASRRPEDAGIKSAFIGSIWLMAVTAPISLFL